MVGDGRGMEMKHFGAGGGGPGEGLGPGEGGDWPWRLYPNPLPGSNGLTWAAWICTGDFSNLNSLIGETGLLHRIRGIIPLT